MPMVMVSRQPGAPACSRACREVPTTSEPPVNPLMNVYCVFRGPVNAATLTVLVPLLKVLPALKTGCRCPWTHFQI